MPPPLAYAFLSLDDIIVWFQHFKRRCAAIHYFWLEIGEILAAIATISRIEWIIAQTDYNFCPLKRKWISISLMRRAEKIIYIKYKISENNARSKFTTTLLFLISTFYTYAENCPLYIAISMTLQIYKAVAKRWFLTCFTMPLSGVMAICWSWWHRWWFITLNSGAIFIPYAWFRHIIKHWIAGTSATILLYRQFTATAHSCFNFYLLMMPTAEDISADAFYEI